MPSAGRTDDLPWLPSTWKNSSLGAPKNSQVQNEPQYSTEFTTEERTEAWNKAAQAVKTYHDELVEQWQKAMDSLLVYAGLFSAVLTAFNVQSYQLLQPAPTDAMLAALQQISTQLINISVNPSSMNSTQPAQSSDQLPSPPFRASASAVWINALWFSSLVCSLASASIALMVKQWLYEESNGMSGTSRETARLRQHRLDALTKWKVGTIVLIPSVLLQVALFLFLGGLLILLWTIHETVAAVITTLVGALLFFVIIVTILPIFRSDCCYRSPQAFGAHTLVKSVWNGTLQLALDGIGWLSPAPNSDSEARSSAHHAPAAVLPLSPPRAPVLPSPLSIAWFKTLVPRCHARVSKIPQIDTWSGFEQTVVTKQIGFLDRHIASMAYTTTFATEHLKALHIILFNLPCEQVFSCFSDIHRSWDQLLGLDNAVTNSGEVVKTLCGQPFYCALRKVLTIHPDKRDSMIGGDWTELSFEYLLSSYTAADYLPRSGEFLATLALMSMGDSNLSRKAFVLLCLCFRPFDPPKRGVMDVSMTCDAIRDVMAMASYNIQKLTLMRRGQDLPNDHCEYMLSTVHMSLACTRTALISSSIPQLSSEQERKIRTTILNLLASLSETFDLLPSGDTGARVPVPVPQWFSAQVVWWLNTTYADPSKEYETIPDKYLSLHARVLSYIEGDSETAWFSSSNHLNSVIQKQKRRTHSGAEQPPAQQLPAPRTIS